MLVERDTHVATLVRLADDAARGAGRLVFVGGDAGVGKTALVREVARHVDARLAVRVGTADNVTTAAALGVFLDALPALDEAAAASANRLQLFRSVRHALAAGPLLLVLEDLHWADEASLDALRYLGRRLDGLPLLLLATYRHDEVTARHPLALVQGDLANAPGVSRILLPPLTPAAVADLVRAAGAEIDPGALHARTGGNAFFVTEVLAAGDDAVPASVRDAVLARAARLTPAAGDVLAAAALLGPGCDLAVLTAVADQAPGAVDECLDHGMLVAVDPGVGGGYAFRHELARQAVEQTVSAIQRRALHRRALDELTRRDPSEHRTLTYHAVGCADHDAVWHHAQEAAHRSASLGAHREAAALYRTALRVPHRSPADRVPVVEELAYECYLTEQIAEALTVRRQALELHQLLADALGVGADERWLSRLSWFAGRNEDSERDAVRAVATLEPLGDSRELAMAYSNRAQLCMLAHDTAGAVDWSERALAMARRCADTEVEIHALNNIGSAHTLAGDVVVGEQQLARSLDLALASDAHEHAARAYTNLGTSAASAYRFADAERHLAAGIAYCEERDLGSWIRYMQAWQAVARAETGRYDDALELASRLVDHPNIATVSRIPALIVAGQIRGRRGIDGAPLVALAGDLARATGEPQRVIPATAAAAEGAWLAGRTEEIGPLVGPVWSVAAGLPNPWLRGPLAWWLHLAGEPIRTDAVLPEPFARMLAADWAAAAAAWQALDCPLWVAYTLGMDPDDAVAHQALTVLDRLGADRAAEALLRTRRERGLPLPRRPHRANRVRYGQLTAREVDVLRLLAQGLSNKEVADRLVLSTKTVGHHVSAVLRKLDEPTRARAVAAARRAGVLTGPDLEM